MGLSWVPCQGVAMTPPRSPLSRLTLTSQGILLGCTTISHPSQGLPRVSRIRWTFLPKWIIFRYRTQSFPNSRLIQASTRLWIPETSTSTELKTWQKPSDKVISKLPTLSLRIVFTPVLHTAVIVLRWGWSKIERWWAESSRPWNHPRVQSELLTLLYTPRIHLPSNNPPQFQHNKILDQPMNLWTLHIQWWSNPARTVLQIIIPSLPQATLIMA